MSRDHERAELLKICRAALAVLSRPDIASQAWSSPIHSRLKEQSQRLKVATDADEFGLVFELLELRTQLQLASTFAADPIAIGRESARELRGVLMLANELSLPGLGRDELVSDFASYAGRGELRDDWLAPPSDQKARESLAKQSPVKKLPAKSSLVGKTPAKNSPAKKRPATRPAAQRPPRGRTKPVAPEPVFLGVSAPHSARAGETFIARFAAYIKASEGDVVLKLQASADVEAAVGFSPLESARWRLDTPVTVRVTGEHFTVTPAEARFIWSGSENIVHFQVKVAKTAATGKTQLCFEAFIEGIQTAFIPVDLAIGDDSSKHRQQIQSQPHRSVFVSHASIDKDRVEDTLSGYQASDQGVDIFYSPLDLKRGEEWKPALEREILNRDSFLLFWSSAAQRSEWVAWEWQLALTARKPIMPFRLEQPLPALPAELAKFHAGDRFQRGR